MTVKSGYKRSRQRERILELLRGTDLHPAAGWIYDQLKQEFKGLSMGTVYRNLNILLEQGLIEKISCGSTFDRFDGNVNAHYHFLCIRCTAMLDLPMKVDDILDRRVNEAISCTTYGHRLEFYGLCPKCSSD
ncbi:MAG: transcriptional repressor [Dethiobacter sp.]|jgi:Fe2+ or Zn2+ uptake regulation protein|nr:transcriptional repressor [Dethiobacter sp.]